MNFFYCLPTPCFQEREKRQRERETGDRSERETEKTERRKERREEKEKTERRKERREEKEKTECLSCLPSSPFFFPSHSACHLSPSPFLSEIHPLPSLSLCLSSLTSSLAPCSLVLPSFPHLPPFRPACTIQQPFALFSLSLSLTFGLNEKQWVRSEGEGERRRKRDWSWYHHVHGEPRYTRARWQDCFIRYRRAER